MCVLQAMICDNGTCPDFKKIPYLGHACVCTFSWLAVKVFDSVCLRSCFGNIDMCRAHGSCTTARERKRISRPPHNRNLLLSSLPPVAYRVVLSFSGVGGAWTSTLFCDVNEKQWSETRHERTVRASNVRQCFRL